MLITTEKITPKAGDFLKPDGWGPAGGANLSQSDGYADESFPGCQFRLPAGGYPKPMYHLAVNVTVTGGQHADTFYADVTRSRCKIEFVGDGEPSTFTTGWLHQVV